jgi:hypothetical protein
MYQLYGKPTPEHPNWGSLGGDMHTLTMFQSFVQPVGMQVVEVNDGDKDYLFYETGKVLVERNGSQIEVMAKDLQDSDKIIKQL